MGCLFLPFELLIDGVIDGWFFLMQLIIPERYISRTLRIILKILVYIFSSLLFFVMLLGIIAFFSEDPDTKPLGKYMIFIPLGISAVQILFGIIVHNISKKK